MSAHVSHQPQEGTWLIWNDDGQHVRLTESELVDVLAQVDALRERDQ